MFCYHVYCYMVLESKEVLDVAHASEMLRLLERSLDICVNLGSQISCS